jgi:hypothetical protein
MLELNCVNRCKLRRRSCSEVVCSWRRYEQQLSGEKEGSGEVFPGQAQKTLLTDARVSEWVEVQVQLDFDQRCCALFCSVLFRLVLSCSVP